jgi:uncharacterized protein YgiM (DUF1202 family)
MEKEHIMTPRFGNTFQSTILFGTVLLLSACASVNTADSGKSEAIVAKKADDTTRTTIQKGKFENPPEMQMNSVNNAPDSANTPSETAPYSSHISKAGTTRINRKEASVNVRSTPSAKSRSIAVLKAGQAIEVLETRDNWVKITWQKGNSAKQGWMNKAFVEGN